MHLAANARDAMPDGEKLIFETHNVDLDDSYVQRHTVVPRGDYVLREVMDTGRGIPDEHLPHIFEPFYTTKEKGKGTGLGLATVYGIVKQSGGVVWVYSEHDIGTTFKIYFPRVVQASSKTSPAERFVNEAELRGSETLLVLEDENAVRQPACEFLRKCGYNVIEARDGLQAIETASKNTCAINVMVTDVVMPGMSGGQLAEILTASRPDMKVLFVSGHAERIVSNHRIRELDTNFLQNHFTLYALARRIREIVTREQAAASAGAGQTRLG
jgi:two-component system, cell cycle sensor histidine kinase and response regulator CckA